MNEGRSPPHCLREAEATVKASDQEARAFASAALQAGRQANSHRQ